MEVKRFSFLRLYLSIFVLGVLAIVVVLRHLYLVGDKQDFLLKESHARTERTMVLPAVKGMMLDRNGDILAMSRPYYRLAINPEKIDRSNSGIKKLAETSGIAQKTILNKLKKYPKKTFLVLANRLSQQRAHHIMKLALEGVMLEERKGRYYPLGEKASSLTGYIDAEGIGRLGMEHQFNEYFDIDDGQMRYTQNLLGQITAVHRLQSPRLSQDLMLTLDHRIQSAAWEAVKQAVKYHQAQSALAVVVDVKTGDILAMTNYPSFDPNQSLVKIDENTRNKAASDLFEPGSIIKPIALAAVLRHSSPQPTDVIDTGGGELRLGEHTIHDHQDLGRVQFQDVLMKSSNIAMVKLVQALPKDALLQEYERFGLFSPMFSQVPGEVAGRHMMSPNLIEQSIMAYGYGLSVSAMAMAKVYNIIANLGADPGLHIIFEKHRVLADPIMSSLNAKQITDMMVRVTEHGQASRSASIDGISVAGKSGTTHLLNQDKKYHNEYVASFAGFAPADDPKAVVVVMVYKPKKHGHYGGQVAAPLFAKIMRYALHYHPELM